MILRSLQPYEIPGVIPHTGPPGRFDFVVVGSGAAGCVLANRLSADTTKSVLLLEAGPRDRSPLARVPNGMIPMIRRGLYSSLVPTAPQQHLDGRTLFEIRGKVLGGNTSINGIQHARGTPRDYDHWAELGNSGWSYADVLPYFKRSETYSRGGSPYRGGSGPFKVTRAALDDPLARAWIDAAMEAGHDFSDDLNGVHAVGFGAPDEARHNGRRTSASSAYLKPVARRQNLTIVTDAHVRRLIVERGQCEGVEYQHHDVIVRAEAGEVIVSAGVYGSPQLLLLSGIGQPAALGEHGIASTIDLPGVGFGLKDHFGFQVGTSCPLPISDLRHLRSLGTATAVIEYLLLRKGFLAGSAVRAIGQVCSDIADPDWPDLKLQLVNLLMDDGPAMTASRHGFIVRMSMTRPASSGQVSLGSADPTAQPRIDVNYLANPLDIARARSGVRIAREILRQPAMAGFCMEEVAPGPAAKSDDELDRWLRASGGTDSHGVGTCRMGSDDMAVVDDRLRVHGIDRLRVIDASVMPDHVGGNTVAPTLMIAEKGAEMILEGR